MIHGADHGDNPLAVGKGQDRDLGALEHLLNENARAALAKHTLAHHGVHGGPGLLPRIGQRDALAERQPVGLDDGRDGCAVEIGERLLLAVKDLEGGGRNAILLHEVFGKHLAALDFGRLFVGAKAGDAGLLQRVDGAQCERVVRRDHRKVDALVCGEGNDLVDLLCADGHQGGVGRNAAVAGQGEKLRHTGALLELFDDGVLPPAAADYQNFHTAPRFCCQSEWLGICCMERRLNGGSKVVCVFFLRQGGPFPGRGGVKVKKPWARHCFGAQSALSF